MRHIVLILILFLCHAGRAESKDAECAFTHFSMGVYLKEGQDYRGATAEFEAALKCDPQSLDILRQMQSCALLVSDTDRLTDVSGKIFELDSLDVESLVHLTNYYLTEDPPKAEIYLKKLAEIEPANERYLAQLSTIYESTEHWDDLLHLLEKWVQVDSANTRILIRLGALYSAKAEYEPALRYFEQAHRRNTAEIQLFHEWARVYVKKDEKEKAIHIYELALIEGTYHEVFERNLLRLYQMTAKPLTHVDSLVQADSTNIYINRLQFLYASQVSEYSVAISTLNRLIRLDSTNSYYYYCRSICYQNLSDLPEAIASMRQAAARESETSSLWLHLGNLWTAAGHPDSALIAFEHVTAYRDSNANAWHLLGLAYSDLKQWERAINAFQVALQSDSTNAAIWYSMGLVRHEQNDFEQAIAAMQCVLEFEPNHAQANNYVGYSWADANIHLDDALKLIETALKVEPENGFYLDSLGWVYYRKGDYSKAVDVLIRAVELTLDSTIIEHLGDTYAAAHNFENACLYWQMALEKDPKNQTLQAKIESANKK